VHSTASHGGELTPPRLAADARAAGLDFVATTEHNSVATHDAWSRLSDDGLLVILGQEVVTETGHWLALGGAPGRTVGWRYGVQDDAIGPQLEAVRRAGGLCVAAHPYAPYPTGALEYPHQDFDVVEVWNGPWVSDVPWQADNEAALAEWGDTLAADIRRGRWRPAMGNSDTHLAGQLAVPHTVVQADNLSAAAILDGIRAGRSYIAASMAVQLSVELTASAEVRVAVDGVPGGRISILTALGEGHAASLPANGSGDAVWRLDRPDDSVFVRVEVRDDEGRMAALGNPIIVD
jgi:predicted metal-dependent phosphoesterase TrpH